MPGPARSGVLFYALDLERMSTFYQRVLGMRLLAADTQHHVIASDDAQLIIHAIPPHIAATVRVTEPPRVREEQAIKPFFSVPSLEASALAATALGGAVFGPIYSGPGFAVRNAHDPEGNVFQLREWTRAVEAEGPAAGAPASGVPDGLPVR